VFHNLKSQPKEPSRLRKDEMPHISLLTGGSQHGTCSFSSMQFTPAMIGRPRIVTQLIPRTPVVQRPAHAGSQQASAEIHAYIAARDMALAEAERQVSHMTLNRAFLANELVENCLQPARSPYQSQSLPPAEAAREQTRCDAAKRRIAQLRNDAETRHYECAVAA
jgi:hypothetical protein